MDAADARGVLPGGRSCRAGRKFSRCVLLYHPDDADLPRRELEVTFPPKALLEEAWRDPARLAKPPSNVAASVERLREELRPERGPVRWERIVRRRVAALTRIDAVARYVDSRQCRRGQLLGYFGERLIRCSGCDVCDPPGKYPAGWWRAPRRRAAGSGTGIRTRCRGRG